MITYTQKLSMELMEALNSELAESRLQRPNLSRSMLVREMLEESIERRIRQRKRKLILKEERQAEQQEQQEQLQPSQMLELLNLLKKHQTSQS